MGMAAAVIVGVAVLAAYVAVGVWATRLAWSWSSEMEAKWMRVALASTVAFFFFMPGIVGAGHGIGIGPVWLMFATGTFNALTTASKVKAMLAIAVGWVIALAVGHLTVGTGLKSSGRQADEDNPFR